MADFKSEWPRSNRNQWPTSVRNRWPTSPGIRTQASDSTDQALFAAANNSNNITNLNGAEQLDNGFTPSGYDIYVFEAETAGFGANDLLNFTSSLPKGTFAFGFGEDATGKPFASPFTEAGLDTGGQVSVPEPATMALPGTALLGFGVLRRRQRRS